MRALLFIFLFGLFNTFCYSQTNPSINDTRNVYDEKGDYYFGKKDLKKAIVYYNMAYKQDANNYYSVLKKAEAYTSLGLYDQAAECYRIIFETSLDIPNNYRLQYALLLLKNKDIKGFDKWIGKYNDIVYTETSDAFYLSSSEVRAKMYKDSTIVLVENESALNTSESEICPVIYDDKVLFASTRKNIAGSGGSGDYNVYSASYLSGGQLGRLNLFNTSLNSTQNESSILVSDKKVYFTRSASINSKLKAYVTDIPVNANDKLDVKEFLLEGFSSIGHISFNSKGTKLFFVSEAPGGLGGLDIYSSDLAGGKWSKPKNMGPGVNSTKDEMFPYVLNDTMLYFTSSGHTGSGGLDLYSFNLKKETGSAKNLGSQVNSEYDDYGLTFSPKGSTGYFCSNRPGGFGKEDIYRVHILNLKVKYAAYQFKKKYFMEEDKINLYLSNGDEYNIASEDKKGFNFSFQPGEAYKMVIQHENPLANNIIHNTKLSADQRKKAFLSPEPFQKNEIRLKTGMKYLFSSGAKPISTEYKNELGEISKEYQATNASGTFDLTALAKELNLTAGEIYTIRFIKDDSQSPANKVAGESSLFINNQTISVSGRSFFIVLPLDIEANFTIQTDIDHFKEAFNPKKTGAVKVDAEPVYKEEPLKQSAGFPILVNTETFSETGSKISATELTIIPGTMYILTVGKTDPGTGKEPELVVPLTKGVKYNLGTEAQAKNEYDKALAQITAAQSSNPNEELIDISILSKELDMSEDNIVFSLVPAKQIASQAAGDNVLTTLDVDGRKYYVTNRQKLQVNLKLEQNKRLNIQTDLAYVQENFVPSTIAVKLDTATFSKSIITDPVFDVIVVNFNFNEYSIRPDAKSIIEDKVIQALKGDKRLYVTIKGYTDPLGDAAYNQKLSKNRAEAVKAYLASNGIGDNRIRTFSFGASLSLKDGVNWEDLSESELQKHRKVEIVIYLPK